MSLLGTPMIVFLDEQSAGVDPASRRKMWKVIKSLSKNSAMIVTTHSMEEAEALATKVGIMVEGNFKCFGTVQHLKQKFGKGYEIEFKIDVDRVSGSRSSLINDIPLQH
jgi:ATP-binding cassette subfamily A (ABC1) protein 3